LLWGEQSEHSDSEEEGDDVHAMDWDNNVNDAIEVNMQRWSTMNCTEGSIAVKLGAESWMKLAFRTTRAVYSATPGGQEPTLPALATISSYEKEMQDLVFKFALSKHRFDPAKIYWKQHDEDLLAYHHNIWESWMSYLINENNFRTSEEDKAS
jgi:hypothetical protein